MSQRDRERRQIKCAGCGHVFEVDAPSGEMLLSDHPVSGGGPGGNMAAQGLATVVAAEGPENRAAAREELPAYACPQCGRMN